MRHQSRPLDENTTQCCLLYLGDEGGGRATHKTRGARLPGIWLRTNRGDARFFLFGTPKGRLKDRARARSTSCPIIGSPTGGLRNDKKLNIGVTFGVVVGLADRCDRETRFDLLCFLPVRKSNVECSKNERFANGGCQIKNQRNGVRRLL